MLLKRSGVLVGEAMLKLDVAAVDVAKLREAFEQRFEIWVFLFRVACMPEIADTGNLSARLGPSDVGQRPPHRRAAQERDELAALHIEHVETPSLLPRSTGRIASLPQFRTRYIQLGGEDLIF